MILDRHAQQTGVSIIVLSILFMFVAGCGDNGVQKVKPSANCLLETTDYEAFRRGRPKAEILHDVQWRGNFEQAALQDGRSVSVITYGLFGGPMSEHGTAVLALFIDDRFEKFVRWPSGDTKTRVGDFSILVRALNSEPVSILDLKNEMISTAGGPRRIDIGLTVIFLIYGKQIHAAQEPDLKKNAALRDQFNATRLRIGMTESEVEQIFKSKPIDSGDIEGGSFKIFGSNETLNVTAELHYSNVLVIIKDGSVIGAYSGALVPGGAQREQLRSLFVDLP